MREQAPERRRVHPGPVRPQFLDSSGLSVVLRARAMLARDERALAIICPPGPARRLLELAGVADLSYSSMTRART